MAKEKEDHKVRNAAIGIAGTGAAVGTGIWAARNPRIKGFLRQRGKAYLRGNKEARRKLVKIGVDPKKVAKWGRGVPKSQQRWDTAEIRETGRPKLLGRDKGGKPDATGYRRVVVKGNPGRLHQPKAPVAEKPKAYGLKKHAGELGRHRLYQQKPLTREAAAKILGDINKEPFQSIEPVKGVRGRIAGAVKNAPRRLTEAQLPKSEKRRLDKMRHRAQATQTEPLPMGTDPLPIGPYRPREGKPGLRERMKRAARPKDQAESVVYAVRHPGRGNPNFHSYRTNLVELAQPRRQDGKFDTVRRAGADPEVMKIAYGGGPLRRIFRRKRNIDGGIEQTTKTGVMEPTHQFSGADVITKIGRRSHKGFDLLSTGADLGKTQWQHQQQELEKRRKANSPWNRVRSAAGWGGWNRPSQQAQQFAALVKGYNTMVARIGVDHPVSKQQFDRIMSYVNLGQRLTTRDLEWVNYRLTEFANPPRGLRARYMKRARLDKRPASLPLKDRLTNKVKGTVRRAKRAMSSGEGGLQQRAEHYQGLANSRARDAASARGNKERAKNPKGLPQAKAAHEAAVKAKTHRYTRTEPMKRRAVLGRMARRLGIGAAGAGAVGATGAGAVYVAKKRKEEMSDRRRLTNFRERGRPRLDEGIGGIGEAGMKTGAVGAGTGALAGGSLGKSLARHAGVKGWGTAGRLAAKGGAAGAVVGGSMGLGAGAMRWHMRRKARQHHEKQFSVKEFSRGDMLRKALGKSKAVPPRGSGSEGAARDLLRARSRRRIMKKALGADTARLPWNQKKQLSDRRRINQFGLADRLVFGAQKRLDGFWRGYDAKRRAGAMARRQPVDRNAGLMRQQQQAQSKIDRGLEKYYGKGKVPRNSVYRTSQHMGHPDTIYSAKQDLTYFNADEEYARSQMEKYKHKKPFKRNLLGRKTHILDYADGEYRRIRRGKGGWQIEYPADYKFEEGKPKDRRGLLRRAAIGAVLVPVTAAGGYAATKYGGRLIRKVRGRKAGPNFKHHGLEGTTLSARRKLTEFRVPFQHTKVGRYWGHLSGGTARRAKEAFKARDAELGHAWKRLISTPKPKVKTEAASRVHAANAGRRRAIFDEAARKHTQAYGRLEQARAARNVTRRNTAIGVGAAGALAAGGTIAARRKRETTEFNVREQRPGPDWSKYSPEQRERLATSANQMHQGIVKARRYNNIVHGANAGIDAGLAGLFGHGAYKAYKAGGRGTAALMGGMAALSGVSGVAHLVRRRQNSQKLKRAQAALEPYRNPPTNLSAHVRLHQFNQPVWGNVKQKARDVAGRVKQGAQDVMNRPVVKNAIGDAHVGYLAGRAAKGITRVDNALVRGAKAAPHVAHGMKRVGGQFWRAQRHGLPPTNAQMRGWKAGYIMGRHGGKIGAGAAIAGTAAIAGAAGGAAGRREARKEIKNSHTAFEDRRKLRLFYEYPEKRRNEIGTGAATGAAVGGALYGATGYLGSKYLQAASNRRGSGITGPLSSREVMRTRLTPKAWGRAAGFGAAGAALGSVWGAGVGAVRKHFRNQKEIKDRLAQGQQFSRRQFLHQFERSEEDKRRDRETMRNWGIGGASTGAAMGAYDSALATQGWRRRRTRAGATATGALFGSMPGLATGLTIGSSLNMTRENDRLRSKLERKKNKKLSARQRLHHFQAEEMQPYGVKQVARDAAIFTGIGLAPTIIGRVYRGTRNTAGRKKYNAVVQSRKDAQQTLIQARRRGTTAEGKMITPKARNVAREAAQAPLPKYGAPRAVRATNGGFGFWNSMRKIATRGR